MKRDMDLVRAILLKIEEEGAPHLARVPSLDGHQQDIVVEHVRLLCEAGLLDAIDTASNAGRGFIKLELTWDGHEFLAKVRDPEVWRDTKAGAAKVGALSLGLVGELATGYLKAKMQQLGLPIV